MKVYGHQQIGSKLLTPGRVIVLDTRQYRNAPAVVVQGLRDKTLKVLVLCDSAPPTRTDADDDDWAELPRPITEQYLFVPSSGATGSPHAVVTVTVADIAVVTAKTIKINAEKIIDDVRKREQPRFRLTSVYQLYVMAIFSY